MKSSYYQQKMLTKESSINDFKNAIVNGNINDIRMLLDTKSIDIDMDNGWALTESVKQWNIPVVALLLNYGCSTNYIYNNNKTDIDPNSVSIIMHKAYEINFN
ncbi:putative ORFan [Tupanvirus deep ocean]|uniref:ORFan n=2 Tax=Tupanvirus TaxID=2094720 RepID=A0AC62A6U0_9VIRU|nr:putative ORFan [Tupanvirus deep ocean]QKU33511.1 putative ORFan [Tupanvirus deep ocean]